MYVELLLNAIVQGSLLSLICVGYSLAYGTARVINFAHADVMIAGGGYLVLLWMAGSADNQAVYVMAALFGAAAVAVGWMWSQEAVKRRWLGATGSLVFGCMIAGVTIVLNGRLPFFVAALLAVPWTAMLACGIYQIGYRPLINRGAPRTSVLLVALGFSIATQSVLLVGWGSQRRVFPPEHLPGFLNVSRIEGTPTYWERVVNFGVVGLAPDVTVPVFDLLIVFVFLAVVGVLTIVFLRTQIGDAIVATADSRIGARSCGIPVDRVLGQAFLIGGSIAALGGTLYVLRSKSLEPTAGFTPGLIAFVACVFGGIGSIRGSIVGAFVISFIISFAPAIPLESWVTSRVSTEVYDQLPSLNLADWSYGIVYFLLILVILFRPQGLFSR